MASSWIFGNDGSSPPAAPAAAPAHSVPDWGLELALAGGAASPALQRWLLDAAAKFIAGLPALDTPPSERQVLRVRQALVEAVPHGLDPDLRVVACVLLSRQDVLDTTMAAWGLGGLAPSSTDLMRFSTAYDVDHGCPRHKNVGLLLVLLGARTVCGQLGNLVDALALIQSGRHAMHTLQAHTQAYSMLETLLANENITFKQLFERLCAEQSNLDELSLGETFNELAKTIARGTSSIIDQFVAGKMLFKQAHKLLVGLSMAMRELAKAAHQLQPVEDEMRHLELDSHPDYQRRRVEGEGSSPPPQHSSVQASAPSASTEDMDTTAATGAVGDEQQGGDALFQPAQTEAVKAAEAAEAAAGAEADAGTVPGHMNIFSSGREPTTADDPNLPPISFAEVKELAKKDLLPLILRIGEAATVISVYGGGTHSPQARWKHGDHRHRQQMNVLMHVHSLHATRAHAFACLLEVAVIELIRDYLPAVAVPQIVASVGLQSWRFEFCIYIALELVERPS